MCEKDRTVEYDKNMAKREESVNQNVDNLRLAICCFFII